jgi:hypothetical protein
MLQFFIPLAISTISGIIAIVTESSLARKYILFAVSGIMFVAAVGVLIYFNGIVSAHENVMKDVHNSLSYDHNYYKGLASKVYFSKDTAEINKYWKAANDTATLRALEKEFVEEFLSNTLFTIQETQNQLRIFSNAIIVFVIVVGTVYLVDKAIKRHTKPALEFTDSNENDIIV